MSDAWMDFQLTWAKGCWLFSLLDWSLSAGDLESPHLIVVLLQGSAKWWRDFTSVLHVLSEPVSCRECFRVFWGHLGSLSHSSCRCEENGGIILAALVSCLVFSSPESKSLASGTSNKMIFSRRYYPMSKSLLLQHQKPVNVAGLGVSGLGSTVFLFQKIVNTEM